MYRFFYGGKMIKRFYLKIGEFWWKLGENVGWWVGIWFKFGFRGVVEGLNFWFCRKIYIIFKNLFKIIDEFYEVLDMK